MCGIVGYVGSREVLPVLLDGLKRLEYRGYDSAGVVVANGKSLLHEKSPGNIQVLQTVLRGVRMEGTAGLGHTRWATHGGVTRANAHPHFSCDSRIGVVHNGIVENFADLRKDLASRHRFTSVTDTEVIPHLIEEALPAAGGDPLAALRLALQRLQGSFALSAIFADRPGVLYVARVNCPIVLGLGEGEQFLASDISALLPYTRSIVSLEEGELARVQASGIELFDAAGVPREPKPVQISWSMEVANKGSYPHYMLKEIHEQARTVAAEVVGHGEKLESMALSPTINRVVVTACGTAWHAGLVGKLAIEELARVPVDVWQASELRYSDYPFGRDTLTIAISQSGETADTLASARLARESGSTLLAVTNGRGSTLEREADRVLHMQCGPERGVAATKTYTSQLIQMILVAIHLGRRRSTLSEDRFRALRWELDLLPAKIGEILGAAESLQRCLEEIDETSSFIYLGRKYNLPTAYEGALKMKEISYLHAEGFAAGELKHGPLALVDPRMTCVAVAPAGRVLDKVLSNIQEVRARGGRVISIATRGEERIHAVSDHLIEIPPCDEIFSPVLSVIPLQLLAYQLAVQLGRNVDQPRNLAKSVTVE